MTAAKNNSVHSISLLSIPSKAIDCYSGGQVDCAAYLIGRGCMLDCVDDDGDSALGYAVNNGEFLYIIQYLKEATGFQSVWFPISSHDCLHVTGCFEVTALLLGCGMDPGRLDNYGQNALHLAAIGANVRIVELLMRMVRNACDGLFMLIRNDIFC